MNEQKIVSVRPKIYAPDGSDMLDPESKPPEDPIWWESVNKHGRQKVPLFGSWWRLQSTGDDGIFLRWVCLGKKLLAEQVEGK